MFQGQQPFYFATVRKLSVAFGTLFNNINIQRFPEAGGQGTAIRTIRVPLSYAAGNKWYIHRKQDIPAQGSDVETKYKTQTKISLPRIGYELADMRYDNQRQINRLMKNVSPKDGEIATFLKQLNPVPYDFQYNVHIATKNMDDGLQILEQVLPSFQPSFNLNVSDIPELSIVRDVPVIFAGITKTDTFEGSFDQGRILEWTLSFVVKGYLYPPITDAAVIRRVIASVYKDRELETKQNVTTVKVDPIDAAYDEEWDWKTDQFDETMLDSNQDPIVDSNFDPV